MAQPDKQLVLFVMNQLRLINPTSDAPCIRLNNGARLSPLHLLLLQEVWNTPGIAPAELPPRLGINRIECQQNISQLVIWDLIEAQGPDDAGLADKLFITAIGAGLLADHTEENDLLFASLSHLPRDMLDDLNLSLTELGARMRDRRSLD